MFICPRCQQRVMADDNSSDYVHECNSGKDVLDQESVVVMGRWNDYTGSGGTNNPNLQGIENGLFGTRAAIEGSKLHKKNIFGKNVTTNRVRQHLEYIRLTNKIR